MSDPMTIEQRLKPAARAVRYSRRVVPNTSVEVVNGKCACKQCIARRAWLAGYMAGSRA